MTVYPRARSARISESKPVASAHAPWTRTIVGVSLAIVVPASYRTAPRRLRQSVRAPHRAQTDQLTDRPAAARTPPKRGRWAAGGWSGALAVAWAQETEVDRTAAYRWPRTQVWAVPGRVGPD